MADEIDALEALLAAATPAPAWTYDGAAPPSRGADPQLVAELVAVVRALAVLRDEAAQALAYHRAALDALRTRLAKEGA